MNMRIYRLTVLAVSVLIASALASSCHREFGQELETGEPLLISPALLDLSTRADGDALTEDDLKDDKYNENKVNRLDVFFFKSDNSFLRAYHITTDEGTVTHGGKEGYLLSANWKKDGFLKNTPYTVYVVANSTNQTIKEAETISIDALQALTLSDPTIYKRYHASIDDDTYTTTKAFLMNANVTWSISSSGTQLVNDANVTLNRAAVKFVLDVSLSQEFLGRLTAQGDHYGTPSWKYVNFNTVTAEVPSETVPEAALTTGGSGAYLRVEEGTGDQQGHYTVVTYAYPQEWTTATAPDKAPAVFLSFPSYHGESNTPAYHYYYIPLCASGVQRTVSNNLYKVNAVISSFGSSEVITSDEIDLKYEVMEWGTSHEADIDAQLVDYLVVTPTNYIFRGGSSNTFLSTTLKYYASSSVSLKDGSIDAYYIDKNGVKQDVLSSQYQINVNNDGTIVLQSKIPTNGTYQQVDFIVTCGEGDDAIERTIKFRHYPLDFITAEDGAYSTYDYSGWAAFGTSGTYIASGVQNNRFNFYDSNPDDHCFGAKVFYNKGTYYINRNGTRGDQRKATANNQMYVLQLTSSSDKYTLGRPVLSSASGNLYANNNNRSIGTVTYHLSNDDVISPAFMLGSQLAALNSDQLFNSVVFAAMHCALYKEVIDGKAYTGWRLPTKQELLYMAKNQRENSDAMDDVITARSYWALNGEAVTNPYYTVGNYTSVRCVRDLSAAELAEINKFE